MGWTASPAAGSKVAVIAVALAQLDGELLDGTVQGGRVTLAGSPVAPGEPTPELAHGSDDEMRQGLVGQGGGKLDHLGPTQARGQRNRAGAFGNGLTVRRR